MKAKQDMSNKIKVKIDKDTIVISSIDTSQHKDFKENRECKERIPFVDGRVYEKWNDDDITVVLSPNKHGVITKLTETEKRYKEIMEALTVIDYDAVEMNRIDIHTDINIEYDKLEKLLRVFHFCVNANKSKTVDIKTIFSEKTMLSEQLEIRTSTYHMKIYDKAKEAKVKGEYCEYLTRIEVSYMRIERQDKKFHLKKLIKSYKESVGNFEEFENQRIESMKMDYDRFIEEFPNTNFTDYVLRRYERIETRNVLESIYKHAGLTGAFKTWLSKFQKTHGIILYTEKDLKDMVARINKSIKEYANN